MEPHSLTSCYFDCLVAWNNAPWWTDMFQGAAETPSQDVAPSANTIPIIFAHHNLFPILLDIIVNDASETGERNFCFRNGTRDELIMRSACCKRVVRWDRSKEENLRDNDWSALSKNLGSEGHNNDCPWHSQARRVLGSKSSELLRMRCEARSRAQQGVSSALLLPLSTSTLLASQPSWKMLNYVIVDALSTEVSEALTRLVPAPAAHSHTMVTHGLATLLSLLGLIPLSESSLRTQLAVDKNAIGSEPFVEEVDLLDGSDDTLRRIVTGRSRYASQSRDMNHAASCDMHSILVCKYCGKISPFTRQHNESAPSTGVGCNDNVPPTESEDGATASAAQGQDEVVEHTRSCTVVAVGATVSHRNDCLWRRRCLDRLLQQSTTCRDVEKMFLLSDGMASPLDRYQIAVGNSASLLFVDGLLVLKRLADVFVESLREELSGAPIFHPLVSVTLTRSALLGTIVGGVSSQKATLATQVENSSLPTEISVDSMGYTPTATLLHTAGRLLLGKANSSRCTSESSVTADWANLYKSMRSAIFSNASSVKQARGKKRPRSEEEEEEASGTVGVAGDDSCESLSQPPIASMSEIYSEYRGLIGSGNQAADIGTRDTMRLSKLEDVLYSSMNTTAVAPIEPASAAALNTFLSAVSKAVREAAHPPPPVAVRVAPPATGAPVATPATGYHSQHHHILHHHHHHHRHNDLPMFVAPSGAPPARPVLQPPAPPYAHAPQAQGLLSVPQPIPRHQGVLDSILGEGPPTSFAQPTVSIGGRTAFTQPPGHPAPQAAVPRAQVFPAAVQSYVQNAVQVGGNLFATRPSDVTADAQPRALPPGRHPVAGNQPLLTPPLAVTVPVPLPSQPGKQPVSTSGNMPVLPQPVAAKQPPQAAAKQPSQAAAKQPPQAAAKQPSQAAAKQPSQAAAKQPSQAAAKQPPQAAAKQPSQAAAKQPPQAAGNRPPAASQPTQSNGKQLAQSSSTPSAQPPSQQQPSLDKSLQQLPNSAQSRTLPKANVRGGLQQRRGRK